MATIKESIKVDGEKIISEVKQVSQIADMYP